MIIAWNGKHISKEKLFPAAGRGFHVHYLMWWCAEDVKGMSGEKKRKNDTHTLTHIDVGDLSFELRHFLYENNAQNPFLIEVPPLIMFFVKNMFYVLLKMWRHCVFKHRPSQPWRALPENRLNAILLVTIKRTQVLSADKKHTASADAGDSSLGIILDLFRL